MISKKILNYVSKYKQTLILGAIALIFADIFGLLVPWLLKYPIDLLSKNSSLNAISPYIFYILIASALQAIFRFSWRKNLYGFSRKVEYDLRNEYFSHLLYLPLDFFNKKRTGDIMSRASNDIKAIREFCGLGSLIIVDVTFTLVVAIALMLMISTKLTIAALIPLPAISIAVFIFKGKIRERFKEAIQKLAEVTSSVRESISGIRIIKSYVREKKEIEIFSKLSREYLNKNLNSAKITAFFTPIFFLTIGLSYSLTLWIGGAEVIKGNISLGELVSFNGFLGILIWPVAAIGLFVSITQKAKASLSRIEQVLSLEPYLDLNCKDKAVDKSIFSKDIKFSKVNFSFNKGEKDENENTNSVIKIDTLTIEAQKTTAIVGAVASGKSVFLRLVARIYEDFDGQISLGGTNIKDVNFRDLRKNMTFVDQESFLFSMTIKENITLGQEKINDNKIVEILKVCELYNEVLSFKKGVDTIIGEKGVNLSGGQKQRIAIARAIINSPKILIMDNPFSSLDTKTQKNIFRNIKRYIPKTTIIIVTHSLKTTEDADIIHVIEKGKITESGKHHELVKKDCLYKRFFKLESLGIYT